MEGICLPLFQVSPLVLEAFRSFEKRVSYWRRRSTTRTDLRGRVRASAQRNPWKEKVQPNEDKCEMPVPDPEHLPKCSR